jgi:hypothetical protein
MFVRIIKPLTPKQREVSGRPRFEKTIECTEYVVEHKDDHTFLELDGGDKGTFTLEHQEGYELYIMNDKGDTIASHRLGERNKGGN